MSIQTYLIDTNVIVGLEDNHTVQPAFAALISLASKHRVGIFVHEAARDDIERDRDLDRKRISLSKLAKFQILQKVRRLEQANLEVLFGPLRKANDVVDATLLHALHIGAADFLISQDRRLHDRARRHSAELGRRVLFVPDAVQLLRTTFEPVEPLVRYVEEVAAHTIPVDHDIFDSLREDYPGFDDWWREKCVKEHRPCWVVEDNGIAGLIVRKDETASNTDATMGGDKILKICTFKVRPERRGVKLGELLLKKVFWFAQVNRYDLVYLTTYDGQVALIDLLEFYGFQHTATKPDGERLYEKPFGRGKLCLEDGVEAFENIRRNYPRFMTDPPTRAFGVPIKEAYHDVLYPDLKDLTQTDLFESAGLGGPKSPGNTIRKVYLCRAQSNLGPAGSILFFYKGKSINPPSQALTAIGIFEEFSVARSTRDLMQMTGGRSVYSEMQLNDWKASSDKPVKVINYLLVGYIEPAITLSVLQEWGVFQQHPPQSIFEIGRPALDKLLPLLGLGFET
jgi:ribosomal protein S18 acetylase RimI-like enzyme/predicted nucleic acid-binding protein